jgi:hypothetical protein
MSSSDTDSITKRLLDQANSPLYSEEALGSNLAEEDEPTFKLSSWIFSQQSRQNQVNDDTIATRRSVYDNPELASLYWPKKDYENIHRFDPAARWTYREEKVFDLAALY